MEKCVFCGWTRRSALPAIRFFAIPREPGMKRIMWMHILNRKELTNRDRVCSVHFRSGRPSSDPSHEDFVPHLYLTSEPPPEVLSYLEDLADLKTASIERAAKETDYQTVLNPCNPTRVEVTKTSRPSILRRKRTAEPAVPQTVPEPEEPTTSRLCEVPSKNTFHPPPPAPVSIVHITPSSPPPPPPAVTRPRPDSPPPGTRNVRIQLLHRDVARAAGVRPGQTVIIKRKIKRVL